MSERFKLEIAYSHDSVGVRIIAKPYGSFHGVSGDIKITGSLSPEDAIAFADALRKKAEEIAAKNAKREAAEVRRRARSALLQQISWRP